MHIQTDRALVPAETPAVRHVTITIAAPEGQPRAERPAVSVALVLDRSGSMDGPKLEMARQAAVHAIRLLDERDEFAVVAYDDDVKDVQERSRATREEKDKAIAAIGKLEAGSSTNLSGGWLRGADMVGSTKDRVRRVMLLTDGLANRGVTDHDELARIAGERRQQGVTTSTFGVGADFDEELLTRIATEGGGHFYFIDRPKQIPDFFASELGETLEVVAPDAALDITCGPGVDVTLLNGYGTETAGGRVRVRLGDLVASQELTVVLGIAIAERPLESQAFIDCRVTDRNGVLHPAPMRVEWRAASTLENSRQPVNFAVLVAAGALLAERGRMTAIAANRRGHYEEAITVLRNVMEHIRQLAPGHPEINAILDALRRDEEQLAAPIDPVALKGRHFASYNVAQSRDAGGRARKTR